jgi:periplasmic protein TonB
VFVFHSKIQTVCVALLLAPALFAEVRVNTAEALRAALSKPSPEYSSVARQMKVTGHVEVEATVATDGSVETVKVLTGNPLLTASAVNAVKKWKFTPFTDNGEPAKALAVLSFDFKP